MLKVPVERPVEPDTLGVIKAICAATAKIGITPLLVGATARVILLEHVYGDTPGRSTRDVDMAFSVESWDQFQSLKQLLIEEFGFTADAQVTHRLAAPVSGLTAGYPVDLIPFGGIEDTKGQIAWPPDMTVLMNVVGYPDALASSASVEIDAGFTVSILSIPAASVLKLLAWSDRHHENHKDAQDFVILLRGYTAAGNSVRVYDFAEILARCEYDPDLAGAWLLGHEAAHQSSAETIRAIEAILTDKGKVEHLLTDMGRELQHMSDDPESHAKKLLDLYCAGFHSI